MADEEARWLRAFHVLFFSCLGLAAVLSVAEGRADAVTLALVALMGGWYTLFVARRPDLLERLNPMGWHLLVLVGLLYVLISRDGVFQVALFGMFALPFVLLPGRWCYLGAAFLVLTAAEAIGWLGEIPENPAILGVVVANTAIVFLVGQFVRYLVRHSEQGRTLGVLEERARLAREIHDTLAQGFIGIIAQLEAAEQVIDDRRAVGERIALAKRLARDNLNEARRSVAALRPEPLERAPLPEALTAVAERWSGTVGVPVTVSIDGQPRPLTVEVETTLLRAAQEGLANVGRHAGATRAVLTLSYMDGQVTLDVLDDGAGFDPAVPRGGYGLVAMRERAARTGGSVTVESAPGEGTALCVSVPCV